MRRRRLAAVANFHRERRLGAKTARFLAECRRRLADRGIDFLIEFVLDRPDAETEARIGEAAAAIPEARLHRLDVGNLGAARAHGVASARAEAVCFVDGDDLFSLNWFEAALDALGEGQGREIVHTQFLVAFGEEQFIRETVGSRDPGFDPMSLAVDWYWNGNLAVPRRLFAEVPIEPYDHAAGFGSEDWHWACNTLAAGIHRIVAPNTCYYYRIKPAKRALGRVGEVTHKPTTLFAADHPPPLPPPGRETPPPVSPLTSAFFARGREIEPFELGVSWLRALEAGALKVKRFRPHTPPLIGRIVREAMAAGFSDGSTVVFADEDRLPGGLATARAAATVLTGEPVDPGRRLYIIEGDEARCGPLPDGYGVAARELREAGLNLPRRHRLVARFLIERQGCTVVNLLSPRRRSLALGFSRATRRSVARWINVVSDYGSDGLSQAWEEIAAFAEAGIEAETVAVFAKTAREAATVRGVEMRYDPALEADWAAGRLGERPVSQAPFAAEKIAEPPPVQLALNGGDPSLGDEARSIIRARAADGGVVLLALGGARPGWALRRSGAWADRPGAGVLIPAVTVIGQDEEPPFTLIHPVARLAEAIAAGRLPAALLLAGMIGLDAMAAAEALDAGAADLGALLRAVAHAARGQWVPAAGGVLRRGVRLHRQDRSCPIGRGDIGPEDGQAGGKARRMSRSRAYFLAERYRGLGARAAWPAKVEARLGSAVDAALAGPHPEPDPLDTSQELLLEVDEPLRRAFVAGDIRFPFYSRAGFDSEQRARRLGSPFIERLARSHAGFDEALVERLWRERAAGMPRAVPGPDDRRSRWRAGEEWTADLDSLGVTPGGYGAVFVAPRWGIGGGEKTLRELADGFERLTGQPSLVVVADTETPAADLPPGVIGLAGLSLRGERFLRLPPAARAEILGDLLVGAGAPRALSINSHLCNSLFQSGRLQAAGIGCGTVIFCIGQGPGGAAEGYIRIANSLIDEGVVLFSDSDAMARILADGFFYDQTVVLAMPAETTDEPPPSGARILWAGRIDDQKRPELLAEVAAAAPDLAFDLWGAPVLSDSAVMRTLTSQPNIRYRGPFTAFAQVDLSDVACLMYTSHFDGTPNLLLEAMGRGLPCLASAVGGVPDLMAGGRGALMDPQASAADWANALRALLTDPGRRAALSRAAKAHIGEAHGPAAFERSAARLLAALDQARGS